MLHSSRDGRQPVTRASDNPAMKHRKKKNRARPASTRTARPPKTREPAPPRRDDEDDLLSAFVRERRPADPERVLHVLGISLRFVQNKRELVDAGWVSLAATQVGDAWVPGVGPKTVYNTLERFVTWMHRRGVLDDWQRLRIQHAIDEARYAHFLTHERPSSRGMEDDGFDTVEELGRKLAETLEHPVEKDLAPSAVRVLAAHLDAQLGPGRCLPFGALDVDEVVTAMLEDMDGDMDAACTFFSIAAAFYRWLGAQGRLDPERAAEQASKLAKAALGTQMAFAC